MKSKKNTLITWIIIIAVIILGIVLATRSPNQSSVPEEIAQCIGENSMLYVQLGCTHCETQKQMFGDNYKSLNIIDCFYERDKCQNIKATPTWLIDGKYYEGVQSIERLQNLTGC